MIFLSRYRDILVVRWAYAPTSSVMRHLSLIFFCWHELSYALVISNSLYFWLCQFSVSAQLKIKNCTYHFVRSIISLQKKPFLCICAKIYGCCYLFGSFVCTCINSIQVVTLDVSST